MSRKNEPKRGIPKEAVHQALQGALGKDGRAGEEATDVALRRAEAFLAELGSKTAEAVRLQKMKTVKTDALEFIIAQHPCSIKAEAIAVHRARRARPGVSVVKKDAAERVFRRGAGNIRTSEDVKNELAGVANAYLEALAEKAALFASSAGRKTIQPADVRNAAALLKM